MKLKSLTIPNSGKFVPLVQVRNLYFDWQMSAGY